MYKNKSFLAIIPARSGSKGLPNKNIKQLYNKPLMAYTIEAVIKAKLFDEIIVSTDSTAYAQTAISYGASVPFLRPPNLATDDAGTYDVIIHVVEELRCLGKTYDYLMLLQPTSPLRNEKHILESIAVLFDYEAHSVVSICEVEHQDYLKVTVDDKGRLSYGASDNKQIRRQDTDREFRLNGAIYLSQVSSFLCGKSFYQEKTYPYIMNTVESIDIDDEYQFKLVEYLMQIMQ
jgi:N-acylneuraminate cytidylyltransferase/CMP-N,N'-diacetyllegionaminic acid synthase